MIRAGCPSHNCGGRCLLQVFVRDSVIVRIETDDRPGDTIADPQLRACVRGRAYRKRQYHPDRLQYPMKRVGKRGEGRFERIGWDEALDHIAAEFKRIKAAYGNEAFYVPYGTGSYNQINGRQTAQRLMNLYGGSLGYYNSYSWAAISAATPTVYGTSVTGNQRQDWLNSKYILMWSWNPAEMRDGTNSEYFVQKAREKGARVVCIDPRMTLSAVALADEWVPIRPGTDAAMMSAMAYVIVRENLYDAEFVRTHCVGFDETQMPAGAGGAESYKDYLLGARDGVPKTPEWAEKICGVPRETIARIAREYAMAKPGVLYQGYGMQRRAYGEQAVRAGCVLAAITGNVGVPGGWASGMALQAPDGGPFWLVFPTGENPVRAMIPSFLWTEAVLRGKDMTGADGVRDASKLTTDIKCIWAVACNALINQHGNVNRTARILADEKKVEFLLVQDNFLTPTARFADILLPVCTQFETWGLEDGWKYGDEVLLMPKILEPPFETKSDYRIASEIAARLGLEKEYTEGRTERDWVDWSLDRYRQSRFPGLPTLDELERTNAGVFSLPGDTAGRGFRRFPARPGEASSVDAVRQDRDLLEKAPRHGQAGRYPGRAQVHPGVGESVRPGGGEVPALGHRAPLSLPRAFDARGRRLARRGLSPAPVHQSCRRRAAEDQERRPRQGLERPRRPRGQVPGDAAPHARRRRPAAGGLVDARQERRRPARLGQRPLLGALDAARLRQRPAYDHGPGRKGGGGLRWSRNTASSSTPRPAAVARPARSPARTATTSSPGCCGAGSMK